MTITFDDPLEERVFYVETKLIVQLDRLARVNYYLTRQLAKGWVGSEVRGAIMDLRSITNKLEELEKEYPNE